MSQDTASTEAQARVTGHVMLLAVQLCFGFFHVIAKWALEGLTPEALAAWRILAGAGVLGPLAWLLHRKSFWPARGDLVRLQICALLGITINQLLYLNGVALASSGNTGLIMGLIPVFTVLLATLVGQEAFSPRRLAGITIALGAAAPLLFASFDGQSLLGNGLLVANAFSYSCYLVLGRPLSRRLPPLVVIAWVFILCVWTIPFFAWNERLLPAADDATTLWALAYVLIFPTTLAYLLNIWALRRVAASTAAIYILLQPLIAAQGGIAWLGESWTTELIIAQVGVIAGILLVSLQRRSGPARDETPTTR